MFMIQPRLPGGRAVLLTDALALAWVMLWILLGLVVAEAVRELTGLTDGFALIGESLGDAADAVAAIELPLVGGGLDGAAGSLRDAGRDVAASGESSRASIERTAAVLGLAVALVPSLPLVIGYLPPRLGRARETGALRQLLRDGAGDPALERFLAHRAVETLTYRELRRVSPRPWRDLEEGRYEALADAELDRLGVRRPLSPTAPPLW